MCTSARNTRHRSCSTCRVHFERRGLGWGNSQHMNFLDTPLQLPAGSCTRGRVQSRAARKRRTMLSRLYTRAAWTARPLTATSHHRVALMSSSSASGKINGEWKGLRLRVAVGFVDGEGRSVAISCVKG